MKTGDVVKVKVLEVDLARGRISLTMRPDAAPRGREGTGPRGDNAFRPAQRGERAPQRAGAPASGGAMAAAFEKLKSRG